MSAAILEQLLRCLGTSPLIENKDEWSVYEKDLIRSLSFVTPAYNSKDMNCLATVPPFNSIKGHLTAPEVQVPFRKGK